jgi:hypothetical protein
MLLSQPLDLSRHLFCSAVEKVVLDADLFGEPGLHFCRRTGMEATASDAAGKFFEEQAAALMRIKIER